MDEVRKEDDYVMQKGGESGSQQLCVWLPHRCNVSNEYKAKRLKQRAKGKEWRDVDKVEMGERKSGGDQRAPFIAPRKLGWPINKSRRVMKAWDQGGALTDRGRERASAGGCERMMNEARGKRIGKGY